MRWDFEVSGNWNLARDFSVLTEVIDVLDEKLEKGFEFMEVETT